MATSWEPSNSREWAEGWLDFLGAPASGPDDPRVIWAMGHQDMEGVFGLAEPGFPQGNINNPFDITGSYGFAGEGDWNSNGGYPVQTFPTAKDGYTALQRYLSNSNDDMILKAYRNKSASLQDMHDAYAASAWNGAGTGPSIASTIQGFVDQPGGPRLLTAAGGSSGPPPSSLDGAGGSGGGSGSGSGGLLGTIGGILGDLFPGLGPAGQAAGTAAGDALGALGALSLPQAVTAIAAGIADIPHELENLFKILAWLADPIDWLRIFCGVAGVVLLAGGVVAIAGVA